MAVYLAASAGFGAAAVLFLAGLLVFVAFLALFLITIKYTWPIFTFYIYLKRHKKIPMRHWTICGGAKLKNCFSGIG
ncbi:MAG: hypothetical protein ACREBH_01175 [Candidatus Micrarchaeaceae archaeon]